MKPVARQAVEGTTPTIHIVHRTYRDRAGKAKVSKTWYAEWCVDGQRRARGGARLRVFRGGSFNTPAAAARSANRSRAMPTRRRGLLGLRPARSITE